MIMNGETADRKPLITGIPNSLLLAPLMFTNIKRCTRYYWYRSIYLLTTRNYLTQLKHENEKTECYKNKSIQNIRIERYMVTEVSSGLMQKMNIERNKTYIYKFGRYDLASSSTWNTIGVITDKYLIFDQFIG